ncbi:unnamed protein product [Orchesella dallaii]|uniref:Uncharacterized protein n=1 Tax=Orchesella dallaii TaxID=48710 RepID=A0ABP1R2V7_9HEXA
MISAQMADIIINDVKIIQNSGNFYIESISKIFSKVLLKFNSNLNNLTLSGRSADPSNGFEPILNFLNTTNYIKEFSSDVPIPENQLLDVFEHFNRLHSKNLCVVIKLEKGRTEFSFEFTENLKQLSSLEMRLIGWEKRDGSDSQSYLLLTGFKSLLKNLKNFTVTTDFQVKAIGADVHCRNFEKKRNAQGDESISLNWNSDCDESDMII